MLGSGGKLASESMTNRQQLEEQHQISKAISVDHSEETPDVCHISESRLDRFLHLHIQSK